MKSSRTVVLLLASSLLAACGGDGAVPTTAPQPTGTPTAVPATPTAEPTAAASAAPAAPATAQVTFEAKSGSKLSGSATLTAEDKGVKLVIKIANVEPGTHGIHVHEKGDCSSADGKSAGGHFNPAKVDHALPTGPRHLGDLGNIEVSKDGTGELTIVMEGANLTADDANSYLGRAIIVHAKKDDGGQPTGNAGGRIGCGPIAPSKGPSKG